MYQFAFENLEYYNCRISDFPRIPVEGNLSRAPVNW